MPKHHTKKKNLFRSFIGYGFHLWILLFVSNMLIFYSFSIFSFGAEKDTKAETNLAQTVSETISQADLSPVVSKPIVGRVKREPTPKPNGPVISLTFTVPGIGSAGGMFRPTRLKRNITVYLYATDVNSNDNKVKPLYSIHTTASYNTNELSPTYTSFINPYIELGDTVKNGKYQVAFVTDQALRKIVKDKEDAIGGKIVTISTREKAILPSQLVTMGDTSPPAGNNIMDINDYNVVVECFGKTSCKNLRNADLNDDGVVDGIDYNIMARSFSALTSQGFAPPQLPTSKPTEIKKFPGTTATPNAIKKNVPSPSVVPVVQKTSGNPVGALFGFIFFVLIFGSVGFFVATKTKFGKAFLATHPLPFLKPKLEKDTKTTTETQPDNSSAEMTPAGDATPEAIAASTEIPVAQIEDAKKATEPVPTPAVRVSDANSVDKTYYVKNKSKDDKGTWFTLTDDAGPIDGLLKSGDIEDGFERIKGTLVQESGKKYILITEVLPSE